MRMTRNKFLMTSALCGLGLILAAPAARAQITVNQQVTYTIGEPGGTPTLVGNTTQSDVTACPSVCTWMMEEMGMCGAYFHTQCRPGDVACINGSAGGVTGMNPGGTTGAGPNQGETGAEGPGCVLCTYYYHKGLIPRKIYVADGRYGRTRVKEATMRGYHSWAIPLTRTLQSGKHPYLEKIMGHVVKSWAYHMAYKMGVHDKPVLGGFLLSVTMEPICTLIGQFAPEGDYEALWI